MAFGKFSLGNCCCNKNKPDGNKCGDHCSGGTIRYYRGVPGGGEGVFPIDRNLVDFTNETKVGTFPRLPFYYLKENEVGYNEIYNNEQDVIQWRLQNDQQNTTIASGYCRSLVPIEDKYYGADLPTEDENNKKTPVLGLNLHSKPRVLAANSYVLAAIFDEEPFLRVFLKRNDHLYIELVIPNPPKQRLKQISCIKTDEESSLIVGIGVNHPYNYFYKIVGSSIWRMNYCNEGIAGRNFVKKDDTLYFSGSNIGDLFEYDPEILNENGERIGGFVVSNNRKVNEYKNKPELYVTKETYLRQYNQGNFYVYYDDGYGDKSWKYTDKFDNWNQQLKTSESTILFPPCKINGNEYQPRIQNYGTDLDEHLEAVDIDGNTFRTLPESTGLAGGFTDEFGYRSFSDEKTNVWRFENGDWIDIPIENKVAALYQNVIKFNDKVFLVLGKNIYILEETQKPEDEWENPEEPEYQETFVLFETINEIAVEPDYNTFFAKAENGEFFIAWENSPNTKVFKKYNIETETFVDISLPVWHIGQNDHRNIYWSEYPYSTRIRDIVYHDGKWLLMTDATIFYSDDLTDWKNLGCPIVKQDGEIKYNQLIKTENNVVYQVLRDETIYTSLITDKGESINYKPVDVPNASNFATSRSGFNETIISSDMIVALNGGGIKHYKFYIVKDDELKCCTKRWVQHETNYRGGITETITNLQNRLVTVNTIRKGPEKWNNYKYIIPEDYLQEDGSYNPDVVDYFQFSNIDATVDFGIKATMFPCLKDGKPSIIVLKTGKYDNIYNAVDTLEYSDDLEIIESLVDWSEPLTIDKMIMEYKTYGRIKESNPNYGSYANDKIKFSDYLFGNEFWIDDRSEIGNISYLFNGNSTRDKERLADFLTIEDGVVNTYYSTSQTKLESDKTSGEIRLRKSNHRQGIEAIGGACYDDTVFCIANEEPYIRIYKWLPNDGIPFGLPKKGSPFIQGYNYHGNNFVLNLDYRCFRHIEKQGENNFVRFWCNPKKKKLLFVPYHNVSWRNSETTNETCYELEWDTHTNDIKFNGNSVGKRDSMDFQRWISNATPPYGNIVQNGNFVGGPQWNPKNAHDESQWNNRGFCKLAGTARNNWSIQMVKPVYENGVYNKSLDNTATIRWGITGIEMPITLSGENGRWNFPSETNTAFLGEFTKLRIGPSYDPTYTDVLGIWCVDMNSGETKMKLYGDYDLQDFAGVNAWRESYVSDVEYPSRIRKSDGSIMNYTRPSYDIFAVPVPISYNVPFLHTGADGRYMYTGRGFWYALQNPTLKWHDWEYSDYIYHEPYWSWGNIISVGGTFKIDMQTGEVDFIKTFEHEYPLEEQGYNASIDLYYLFNAAKLAEIVGYKGKTVYHYVYERGPSGTNTQTTNLDGTITRDPDYRYGPSGRYDQSTPAANPNEPNSDQFYRLTSWIPDGSIEEMLMPSENGNGFGLNNGLIAYNRIHRNGGFNFVDKERNSLHTKFGYQMTNTTAYKASATLEMTPENTSINFLSMGLVDPIPLIGDQCYDTKDIIVIKTGGPYGEYST